MNFLICFALVSVSVVLGFCALLKWLTRFEGVRIVRTFCLSYRNGKGYLQTFNKPDKYFAVRMDSGRLGIMKTDKVKEYFDFGRVCYTVDFHFSGRYVR